MNSSCFFSVPPFFSKPSVNKSSLIGQRDELSCFALGNKPMRVDWWRDGERVSELRSGGKYQTQMVQMRNGTISVIEVTSGYSQNRCRFIFLLL